MKHLFVFLLLFQVHHDECYSKFTTPVYNSKYGGKVWYTNTCLAPCFVKQILFLRVKHEYIALYITLCWL